MQQGWVDRRLYGEWTQKRIDALIREYGKSWFEGKTVLEIGCGHGEIGLALMGWGADVTFSDIVEEFLAYIVQKNKQAKTVLHDCNTPWPFKHFDVIINFGLLYHVHDPKQLLIDCVRSCDDLILESKTYDTPELTPVQIVEDGGFGGAPDHIGTTFGAAFVESVLDQTGAKYRQIDPQANVAEHIEYVPNSGRSGYMRTFWLVDCRK